MTDARHSYQTVSQGIHIPHSYSYASASARTAATGFVAGDVGKLALQTDNQSLWRLIDDSPIAWQKITGPSSTVVVATDGRGDCTTIQDGIDALPSTGGQVLVLDGTYTIDEAVVLAKSNSELILCRGAKVELDDSSNDSMLEIGDGVSAYDNIRVHGGEWDGNRSGQSSYPDAIVIKEYVSKSVVEHVELYDHAGRGIVVDAADHILIQHCETYGGYGPGIYIDDEPTDHSWCTLFHNHLHDGDVTGIHLFSCNHVHVIDNRIENNGEGGITLNVTCDHCIVRGNQLHNNGIDANDTYYGIQMLTYCFRNQITENNILEDHGSNKLKCGIYEPSGSSNKNVITDNVVYGCVSAEISASGANSIVADNMTV